MEGVPPYPIDAGRVGGNHQRAWGVHGWEGALRCDGHAAVVTHQLLEHVQEAEPREVGWAVWSERDGSWPAQPLASDPAGLSDGVPPMEHAVELWEDLRDVDGTADGGLGYGAIGAAPEGELGLPRGAVEEGGALKGRAVDLALAAGHAKAEGDDWVSHHDLAGSRREADVA